MIKNQMETAIFSDGVDDRFEKMLTVKDIQVILGVGQVTAYNLVHSKSFPAIRIGRQYRVPLSSFNEWITNNQHGGVQ